MMIKPIVFHFSAEEALRLARILNHQSDIASVTTWSKRIGGSVVVLVGIYLFYLGITL